MHSMGCRSWPAAPFAPLDLVFPFVDSFALFAFLAFLFLFFFRALSSSALGASSALISGDDMPDELAEESLRDMSVECGDTCREESCTAQVCVVAGIVIMHGGGFDCGAACVVHQCRRSAAKRKCCETALSCRKHSCLIGMYHGTATRLALLISRLVSFNCYQISSAT
ncbi:uncharacterized protein LAESUDRAFT_437965 [Laetiporus sulphureus 93-53]|uniref:Uncharacterized protein n=1 Tax=Laetiporus sulphureus 93-53 TaxID=1314785 RepID=A0A165C1H4_9APHY|nr:uncharacterized protein LAESUDRAFT_437965 [Laetiporus sulphureus 93-53]KZT02031.1 hypothetical protein LAESUDRAFT_437965 [Laetiporus sulphureus 93-53]